MLIRLLTYIVVCFFWQFSVSGQTTLIKNLTPGYAQDSSFYDVAKINDNEYWIGGEFGILYKTDTLGNLNSILKDKIDASILKIQHANNYVFIATDKSQIVKYDLQNHEYVIKSFPQLENKCIYDLIVCKDGTLMICGGKTDISKSKLRVPRGFIATLDTSLTNFEFSWTCYRKFVWSLIQLDNGDILASCFDGLTSSILVSDTPKAWKRKDRVFGLVHEFYKVDNEVWYSGTQTFNVSKNGIYGKVFDNKGPLHTFKEGSVWALTIINGTLIGVTQTGEIFEVDTQTGLARLKSFKSEESIYDCIQVGKNKMIIVGHGKSAYIVKTHDIQEI